LHQAGGDTHPGSPSTIGKETESASEDAEVQLGDEAGASCSSPAPTRHRYREDAEVRPGNEAGTPRSSSAPIRRRHRCEDAEARRDDGGAAHPSRRRG